MPQPAKKKPQKSTAGGRSERPAERPPAAPCGSGDADKRVARNLTNRTIECHLPGARWMRLKPGERSALSPSDRMASAIRKLQRDGSIEVYAVAAERGRQKQSVLNRLELEQKILADKSGGAPAPAKRSAPNRTPKPGKHAPKAEKAERADKSDTADAPSPDAPAAVGNEAPDAADASPDAVPTKQPGTAADDIEAGTATAEKSRHN